jgi:hypothetical protein
MKTILKIILFTLSCPTLVMAGPSCFMMADQPVIASRTKDIIIPIHAAGVNPSVTPDEEIIGTYMGYGFDHDDEYFITEWNIAEDWDGVSDMIFHIHYATQSGDVIAEGETVKFDCTYRSRKTHDGEAYDGGSAVSITSTYTQSGAGIDKHFQYVEFTIVYNHADQPLAVNDQLGIKCDRDVTGDSYSGKVVVIYLSINYSSNKLSAT